MKVLRIFFQVSPLALSRERPQICRHEVNKVEEITQAEYLIQLCSLVETLPEVCLISVHKMVEIFYLAGINCKSVTSSEEHLDLLDDVNVIDAQRWFTKHKPAMNFQILFLLELLVILSRELIHVFLP